MKNMKNKMTIVVTSFLMMPIILIYGIYIQISGENSPGGGFQSGIVFSVIYILYSILFDIESAFKILPKKFFYNGVLIGVLIYVLTGIVTMFYGGDFLEYAVFSKKYSLAQSIGVFIIEIGVGLTVFCAMVIFYTNFILSNTRKKQ